MRKGEEKNVDQLETSEHEVQHTSEIPDFSFCLIYPRLDAREVNSLGIPKSTDKESSPQSLLSVAKETEKEKSCKTEKHLDNNYCISARNHYCGPTPTTRSKG